tara:strand:+ start:1226 stop:1612 length:387 start_codon:yes stop_codon:yes gene_type:complete
MNEIKRTDSQNRALHLWLSQKAKQCREAGISPKQAFEKTIELEMTEEIMKEIWRTVQRAMYKKISTKDLSKHEEIEEIVEHLNRFFATEFNLEGTPFPDIHQVNGFCGKKGCVLCNDKIKDEVYPWRQ